MGAPCYTREGGTVEEWTVGLGRGGAGEREEVVPYTGNVREVFGAVWRLRPEKVAARWLDPPKTLPQGKEEVGLEGPGMKWEVIQEPCEGREQWGGGIVMREGCSGGLEGWKHPFGPLRGR